MRRRWRLPQLYRADPPDAIPLSTPARTSRPRTSSSRSTMTPQYPRCRRLCSVTGKKGGPGGDQGQPCVSGWLQLGLHSEEASCTAGSRPQRRQRTESSSARWGNGSRHPQRAAVSGWSSSATLQLLSTPGWTSGCFTGLDRPHVEECWPVVDPRAEIVSATGRRPPRRDRVIALGDPPRVAELL